MSRARVRAYTDRGIRIQVLLYEGQAVIRIGGEEPRILGRGCRLDGFFRALGTDREVQGLADVLRELNYDKK